MSSLGRFEWRRSTAGKRIAMPRVGRLRWKCDKCNQYPAYAVLAAGEVRIACFCKDSPAEVIDTAKGAYES